MKRSCLKWALLLAVFTVVTGCSEPPAPPEVQLAHSQEQDLWRAGASIYAPDNYKKYLSAIESARDLFARERSRFVWFRDYQPVADTYAQIVSLGNELKKEIEAEKNRQGCEFNDISCALQKRIKLLRELSETLKDKRLAMRKLVQAELRLEEAARLSKEGRSKEAKALLDDVKINVDAVVKTIKPMINRYADKRQIAQWRALVEQAIDESKRSGGEVIVVSKIDRELTLYRRGAKVRTYDAGLGYNYLADKLYAGDRATPEGRYRVIKKLNQSKFYKALLIDYPNAEDQQRYAQARRQKLIPRNAGIGSLIEIHGGGGDNSVTYGCVSLDNRHMEELFETIAVGTPVVIVGAVDYDNIVSSTLSSLN